jgi:hypothetical protein
MRKKRIIEFYKNTAKVMKVLMKERAMLTNKKVLKDNP